MKFEQHKLLQGLSYLVNYLTENDGHSDKIIQDALNIYDDEYEFIKNYNGTYQMEDSNHLTTFIFPLKVLRLDPDRETYEELNGDYANCYKEKIIERFINTMYDIDITNNFCVVPTNKKIISFSHNFLSINNTLYGTVTVISNDILIENDIKNIKEFIESQNRYEIGSYFEKKSINANGFIIYIQLWNRYDDYFILTFDEFVEKLNKGEIK